MKILLREVIYKAVSNTSFELLMEHPIDVRRGVPPQLSYKVYDMHRLASR